jgi:hypothetical protein
MRVVEANNLMKPFRAAGFKANPFVEITVCGIKWISEIAERGGSHPNWGLTGQTVPKVVVEKEESIHVKFTDLSTLGNTDMGFAKVAVAELLVKKGSGVVYDAWHPVQPQGMVRLRTHLKPYVDPEKAHRRELRAAMIRSLREAESPGKRAWRRLSSRFHVAHAFREAGVINRLEKNELEAYICPLSGGLMRDPVVCADGQTYERQSIEKWLKDNCYSPINRQQLRIEGGRAVIFPNALVRDIIQSAVRDEIHVAGRRLFRDAV